MTGAAVNRTQEQKSRTGQCLASGRGASASTRHVLRSGGPATAQPASASSSFWCMPSKPPFDMIMTTSPPRAEPAMRATISSTTGM
jgi:hypothetical protein